jgi:hypothetical protein
MIVHPVGTTSDRLAPKLCFTDPKKLMSAIRDGYCTHAEVRNVLGSALRPSRHPAFAAAVTASLATSYCHLVVDESFDMNQLDAAVIEAAITAHATVTLVGDTEKSDWVRVRRDRTWPAPRRGSRASSC